MSEAAKVAGGKPDGEEAEREKARARLRRVSDGAAAPLIPDCCNLGVALRVFAAVNVMVLVSASMTTDVVGELPGALLHAVAVAEPATLLSLLAACAARRVVNGRSRAWQWAAGLGIPAGVTALVAMLTGLLWNDGMPAGAAWSALPALAAGALAGAACIVYFDLRARAFSPSLSEARLQALQARIRPHFLFNSLNTVLSLMRARPREAETTLENLADLFRVFMRDTRELVPLDDEVQVCRQYLEIEQLRLGDRLSVRWDLAAMPGDALLPSLLLQPLVENAVHHGIEPRPEAGEIAIAIERRGDRVRVEIVNPLAASGPVRPGNQMALSNVRERLMLLYDMEAELRSGPEDGRFRLELEFPYRQERRRRDVRRHHHPHR